MALIWKSGYTTGVPELDQQHEQVFTHLNELEARIARGEFNSPEVDESLKILGKHVMRHFSDEECCMDRHHCPMALKNKQEHEEFLNQFVDFMTRFSQDQSLTLLREFHTMAENWMHEHIAFVDIHLRSSVESTRG